MTWLCRSVAPDRILAVALQHRRVHDVASLVVLGVVGGVALQTAPILIGTMVHSSAVATGCSPG